MYTSDFCPVGVTVSVTVSVCNTLTWASVLMYPVNILDLIQKCFGYGQGAARLCTTKREIVTV